MPRKFCQCTGCPACDSASHLFEAGKGPRCPPCERHHDQARGTRQQRGYDAAHDAERERRLAQWRPGQPCAIGGEPTWDSSKLDLAHNKTRTGWLGLACHRHNRGHAE